MDFSKVIEYDKSHQISIPNPNNGEPSGIVINVVSQDSARVVKALREYQSEQWAREAVGEKIDFAKSLSERNRIVLIECIDSWEWGDNTFAHIDNNTPCDKDAKTFLVDHPNAKWIVDLIAEGCANIRNFTQASPKSVKPGSKKT